MPCIIQNRRDQLQDDLSEENGDVYDVLEE